MSKKKMNEKVDAGENVKRDRPEKKPTKVNGEPKFENGKLVTPEQKTATEKLMEMQKKKAEMKEFEPEPAPKTLAEAQQLIESLRAEIEKLKTRHIASKLEDLPDEEDCPIQYINFCQVQKARDEMLHILEEVEKIPGIEIRHNAYAECYRINNKLVGELFPLKRQWSARISPGVVKRWETPDEYLKALKARIAEVPEVEQKDKPVVKTGKSKKIESVQDIKQRIEKLSNGRNAIHIKNVTAEIKQYADAEGYHFVDDGHTMVVRGWVSNDARTFYISEINILRRFVKWERIINSFVIHLFDPNYRCFS